VLEQVANVLHERTPQGSSTSSDRKGGIHEAPDEYQLGESGSAAARTVSDYLMRLGVGAGSDQALRHAVRSMPVGKDEIGMAARSPCRPPAETERGRQGRSMIKLRLRMIEVLLLVAITVLMKAARSFHIRH